MINRVDSFCISSLVIIWFYMLYSIHLKSQSVLAFIIGFFCHVFEANLDKVVLHGFFLSFLFFLFPQKFLPIVLLKVFIQWEDKGKSGRFVRLLSSILFSTKPQGMT